LNGGTCVSLKPNYKCRCHDHFYGNHCELSTFGLEEFSYASFPPLDANTNDISVIFATSKPNSLLVYNFGKSAGGRSDFLSVELVDGHPRLSWGGARTAITRLSLTNKRVDTGRWYKVTATRNNRVGSLSVEDCTESGEYCKACQPDDPRCFTKDIGEAGTLVFHKNPMFFGGLEDEIAVLDRPGQLDSVDFVGCIKSISINGNEKNLLTESLNRTGLTDTCNYVESGSCTRGDECGDMGTCIPLWSYHKCKCGLNSIVASDCGPSFQPFTLTENQEIHFRPSRKYQHSIKLSKIPSRWKREIEEDDQTSMSLTFRTLTSECILLRAINRGLAYTQLGIKEDGILEYRSQGSSSSSSEVVLSTDVNVADGSWHTLRLEATGNVLRLLLDESRVGYEVEFSAVHNFLDPNMDKYIIGNANDKGYRGCVTNFTLNNELQSVRPTKKGSQLLEADVPAGVHMDGCDVEILRVAQPKTAVDVGVTVVIIFFVVVLCTIAASFTFFKLRRKVLKGQLEAMKTNSEVGGGQGIVNRSLDLRDEQQLNNSRIPQHQQHHQHQHQQQQLQQQQTSSKKPDIIEADQSRPFSNFEAMEHYDIENASSIAPSDIDIVYHYKGYREGHRGRSLPKKRGRNSLNNTPLARLSPSSEMSHRILTLKDLSGKPTNRTE
jgi:protocadherin Fat 4